MTLHVEGAVKPSSIENATFDNLLDANRVTDIPSNQQIIIDYNSETDGQPLYVGYAPRGLASSSTGWLLYKFTYDGNSPRQMLTRTIAYDSWDNRASASYG